MMNRGSLTMKKGSLKCYTPVLIIILCYTSSVLLKHGYVLKFRRIIPALCRYVPVPKYFGKLFSIALQKLYFYLN